MPLKHFNYYNKKLNKKQQYNNFSKRLLGYAEKKELK